jgi:uncharacterized protein YbjT (DUF2867 family)
LRSELAAAVYLIHSIDDTKDYYLAREARGAEAFLAAAERAGVRRIVYLAGVAPKTTSPELAANRVFCPFYSRNQR